MPSGSLGNLSESIFCYWMRMTNLVREMITWEPNKNRPMMVNGQKVPVGHETDCKSHKNTVILMTNIIFSVLCCGI